MNKLKFFNNLFRERKWKLAPYVLLVLSLTWMIVCGVMTFHAHRGHAFLLVVVGVTLLSISGACVSHLEEQHRKNRWKKK